MRRWLIDIPVWDCSFALYTDCTREECYKDLIKLKVGIGEYVETDAEATCFLLRGRKFAIWLPCWASPPLPKEMGQLAHEAVHGARHVLENSCTTLTVDLLDEPAAYLVSFIVARCVLRLNGDKKKRKKGKE